MEFPVTPILVVLYVSGGDCTEFFLRRVILWNHWVSTQWARSGSRCRCKATGTKERTCSPPRSTVFCLARESWYGKI